MLEVLSFPALKLPYWFLGRCVYLLTYTFLFLLWLFFFGCFLLQFILLSKGYMEHDYNCCDPLLDSFSDIINENQDCFSLASLPHLVGLSCFKKLWPLLKQCSGLVFIFQLNVAMIFSAALRLYIWPLSPSKGWISVNFFPLHSLLWVF